MQRGGSVFPFGLYVAAYRTLVVDKVVPVFVYRNDKVFRRHRVFTVCVGKQQSAPVARPVLTHALFSARRVHLLQVSQHVSAGYDDVAHLRFRHIRIEILSAIGTMVVFYVAVLRAACLNRLMVNFVCVVYRRYHSFFRNFSALLVRIIFSAYGAAPIFDIAFFRAGSRLVGVLRHVVVEFCNRYVFNRRSARLVLEI